MVTSYSIEFEWWFFLCIMESHLASSNYNKMVLFQKLLISFKQLTRWVKPKSTEQRWLTIRKIPFNSLSIFRNSKWNSKSRGAPKIVQSNQTRRLSLPKKLQKKEQSPNMRKYRPTFATYLSQALSILFPLANSVKKNVSVRKQ